MFPAGDRIPIMEVDGRWRAHIQQAPNCPRCASSNTKFCYYNNYSLAQPRYFCKGCRRYWTKGGSLRNVPEGGGCRKTRRSRSKSSSDHRVPCPPQQPENDSSSLSSVGPEIDLAAVFARYLNPDSSSVVEPDVQLASEQTEQVHEGDILGLESFDYGLLQTEDVFWSTSEDGSSLSSGFTAPWEPVVNQEELDSSTLGLYASALYEPFRGSSTDSFLSDVNWSCFDSAGYGDFCRT